MTDQPAADRPLEAPGPPTPAAPPQPPPNPYASQPYPGVAPAPQPASGADRAAPGPYGPTPPAGPNPYGAAAPAENPYGAPQPAGSYAAAPAYAGGQPAPPGTLPYVQANFGRVADFGERAIAYLIDLAVTLSGLILVILGGVLLAAATSPVTLDDGTTVQTASDPVLGAIGGLLLALGYAGMFGLWLWNRVIRMGRTGQSIGKGARGLRLVDAQTGQPIGAGSSFLRDVVHGLANSVVYLSFLWMLWDPDKQTLGDKAVHSAVIHVPQ